MEGDGAQSYAATVISAAKVGAPRVNTTQEFASRASSSGFCMCYCRNAAVTSRAKHLCAFQTITKGLTMFGETVASSLAGTKKKESSGGPGKDDKQPGIVTVIDMVNIGEGQVSA